jgi:hypothetical protein
MVALIAVGLVSHGIIRHVVQTAPLWIAIALGIRRSEFAKWAAVPCLVLWFLLMAAIWLFLLGWARLISGTFTPVETALTIVVGAASLLGCVSALRTRTQTRPAAAVAVMLALAVLQIVALRVSFLPAVAHR